METIENPPNPANILFLLIEIAIRRRKLQELYNKKGRTDADVLEVSVELDVMNRYQRCLTK